MNPIDPYGRTDLVKASDEGVFFSSLNFYSCVAKRPS